MTDGKPKRAAGQAQAHDLPLQGDCSRETAPAVLVIDDDIGDRNLCRRAVQGAWGGESVFVEADSGELGLRRLQQHPIQCVLLDFSLPGMDGIEVLRRIRLSDRFLPVVMIDGRGNDAIAVQSMKDGAQDYLVKSTITPSVLRRAIQVAIAHCAMTRDVEDARKIGARLAAIVESTDDAIVGKNLDGIITDWNHGAEKMFGYLAQDAIGQSDEILRVPGTAPVPPRNSERRNGGAITGQFETVLRHQDGHLIDISETISPIRDPAGQLVGECSIARDITEANRAKAELEAAKIAAESANQAKSTFLSSMSHELRTPLNAILGFAQLLESDDPKPSPGQNESIGQILDSGWYLLHLIEDLLDCSAIESGSLTVLCEPVCVAEVLLRCQAMMQPLAANRGIAVSFPRVDASCCVLADRTRLQQILLNILSNAIKYNRVNGSITVECAANQPGLVRISVSDTGMGLTRDQIEHLYQPFNRLGQDRNCVQGTGIGLFVTKQLVEAMRGKIGIASTVDIGTEFWVDLIAVRPS